MREPASQTDGRESGEEDASPRELTEDLYRQMAESIDVVFWLRGGDGAEILYVSPAYEEIWGRPVDEVCGGPASWVEAIHPEDRDRVRESVLRSSAGGFEEEYRIVRPDGEIRWIHDRGFPVRGADADCDRVAGVARDVTDRKRLEHKLRHQALHDHLTGLANRTLLADRVEQGLAQSRRHDRPMGLLMLDVDHFKRVNDRLGHAAGDRVLRELARRLQQAVRDEDTVARWGGDEFVVVLPELAEPEAVKEVRERIRAAVRPPIDVDGNPVHVDLTAGAVVNHTGDHRRVVQTGDPEELIRFASLALHWAKEEAPGGFSLFDPTEEVAGATRIRREGELRGALERGEIVPYYQPIVRLGDRSRVGLEALARWEHPERGLLPPSEFVPMAEDLGLIAALQEVVLRRGCREVAAWERRNGDGPLSIGFNLSGQQFRDRNLAEGLEAVVKEAGCRPGQVFLEVTETSVMQTPATIKSLREVGFRVLVDDFGTGYSTFSYLRDLELDGLKIDMSFVQGITESDSDSALVETMLTLGERLGLDVIPEGVESEAQLQRLRTLGCTLGQGYLFGRPAPAEEVAPFAVEAAGQDQLDDHASAR